jgi:hypothetical protein
MKKSIISKTLILVLLAFTALTSCEKDEKTEFPDEITINQKNIESGTLSVTLKDGSGNAIADQIVDLYDGMSRVERLKTNSSGAVNFGDLLQGTYSIYCEDVSANGNIFQINKTIQILTGKTKNLSINVEEYVGTVTVDVKDYWNDDPVANANVKLIRTDDYDKYYSGSYSELIPYTVVSGSTNTNGEVILTNVPTEYYLTLVYNETDTTISSSFSVSIYDEIDLNIDL